MKLKATNPLVLFVGALAIGLAGCADDVIITEPPPPPPPPPPEAAEISIVSITDADTQTELGKSEDDPIGGTIGVIVNFDTGGFEAAALDVFVDSDKVPCQTFSGQAAVGFSADVQTVQCIIDTEEGIGSCTGSTLLGRFENGPHIISAELTLQDGSSVTATRLQPLLFANSNSIIVVPNDIGPRVVGLDAQGWWGGPRDLTWFACPVIFSASLDDVCDITASATGGMILGGPSGTSSSETSQDPFTYTASYRDVAGVPVDADPLNEDLVESMVSVTPTTVLACDGTDITSSFVLTGDTRPIDSTAPMCSGVIGLVGDGDCEPVIDGTGMFVLQNGLYSDGAITLDDVVDGGVGIGSVMADAFDFADGDPDNQTLFLADVADIDDLDEDDGCGSDGSTDITTQFGCVALAEAGVPVDAYFLVPSEVADLLLNALGDGDNDIQIDDVFDDSEEFGVDQTPPDITDILPDSDGTFVWNPVDTTGVALDETIMFETLDPDLLSGDDPSGIEEIASCAATCADQDADGNLIEGELLANPLMADDGAILPADDAGVAGDDMFELDFCGTLTSGCARVAGVGPSDGSYTVEIRSSDKAVKENNVGTAELTFELDVTPPQILPFTTFPAGTNTSNSPLQFDLAGSLSDANLRLATAGIFIDSNASLNDDCGILLPTDLTPVTQGSGPGEVDDQSQDITATASAFSVSFIVTNPAPSVVKYCFIVDADDTAEFKDGSPNRNESSKFTASTVTWQ